MAGAARATAVTYRDSKNNNDVSNVNYTLLSDTEHLIPETPVLLLDLISENIALRTDSKNYAQFVLILMNSNSKTFYIVEVNLPDMIMFTLVSCIYFNPWKR